MGGEGDPAQGGGRGRAQGRQVGRHRQQGAARQARRRAGDGSPKRAASRSISRRRSAARIPIVKTLREGLAGNSLARIYGILNGTCNYILTRMEQEKLSFDDCLKEAQRLGYAEADPTFDVEGHDTAQKLAILASIAFGTKVDPDAIYVEGISSIAPDDLAAADELGYRVKLLGVAVRTDNGIEQRVHPTMVPKASADRAGDGRHQRGDDRCRRDRADHAGRPRRRRHGDRLGGGLRHRRHRARRARAAVRAAGRAAENDRQGADAAPRRRLLHPAAGRATGRAPRPPSPRGLRSSTSRWNRSCSATATARRRAATIPAARPSRCRSSSSPMRPPKMRCARRSPRSSATR